MNQKRIKQLEKFLKEEPNDPFTLYALAIEHLSFNKDKSTELFEELLKNHPDYIGTYYHAAALYAELGLRDKADKIYRKGIEVAKTQNNPHALRELNTAYLNFQLDDGL